MLPSPLESAPASTRDTAPAATLVIILASGSTEAVLLALRYAAAAAAMDVVVELHAVGAGAAACFGRDAAAPSLLAQIRQAVEFGADIFVCPLALAEQGLRTEDLIEEVAGVRGAASLLAAGLAPGARFLNF